MPLYPYIPYAYFLRSRLITKFQRLSWVFVYFIPILVFWIFYDASISLLYLIFSYLCVNTVYENGYIQNDTYTIKMELSPTLRIPEKDIAYIRANTKSIFFIRLTIVLLLFLLIFIFSDLQVFLVLVSLIFTLQVLFIIYNIIRNRVNLFLIIPLSYLRFYAPLIAVCLVSGDMYTSFLLLLIYPLPKFIEFMRNKKYDLPKLSKSIGNIDRFRVIYYFIIVILMYFIGNKVLFTLSIYYLTYRTVSLLFFNAILKGNAKLLSKTSSDRGYR